MSLSGLEPTPVGAVGQAPHVLNAIKANMVRYAEEAYNIQPAS